MGSCTQGLRWGPALRPAVPTLHGAARPRGPEMPSFALKEVRPGQGLLGAAGNFKAQPSRAAVSLEGTAMSARAGRPPGRAGHFSGLPPSARWIKARPEQRGLPGPGRLWPRPLAPQGWWPGIVRMGAPGEKGSGWRPHHGKAAHPAFGLRGDPWAEGQKTCLLRHEEDFLRFGTVYRRNSFYFSLGPHPWHMEVLRLVVEATPASQPQPHQCQT